MLKLLTKMINEKFVYAVCKDDISLIENYDKAIADTSQVYVCHHKAGILPCGRFSREDLKKFNLYWHRPANELIFLTKSEHIRMHAKVQNRGSSYRAAVSRGLHKSDKFKKAITKHNKSDKMRNSCREMGKNNKGKSSWNKGLPYPHKGTKHTDITKKHLSEMAKKRKGKVYCTNGLVCKMFYPNEIPIGWRKGGKKKTSVV